MFIFICLYMFIFIIFILNIYIYAKYLYLYAKVQRIVPPHFICSGDGAASVMQLRKPWRGLVIGVTTHE